MKLIGALSVWLGYKLVLPVLGVTTVLVAAMHIGFLVWGLVTRGSAGLRRKRYEKRAEFAKKAAKAKKEAAAEPAAA